MREEAVEFVVCFAVVLGAAIWWLTRDSGRPRPPGSSGHFSPGDPGSGHEGFDR